MTTSDTTHISCFVVGFASFAYGEAVGRKVDGELLVEVVGDKLECVGGVVLKLASCTRCAQMM